MSYPNLKEFVASEANQGEITGFIQHYHQFLESKFSFPPLKQGKALHTFAEVLGYDNWHQISAKASSFDTESSEISDSFITSQEDDSKSDDNKLYMVDYWELERGSSDIGRQPPAFLQGYQKAITYLFQCIYLEFVFDSNIDQIDTNIKDLTEDGDFESLQNEFNKLDGALGLFANTYCFTPDDPSEPDYSVEFAQFMDAVLGDQNFNDSTVSCFQNNFICAVIYTYFDFINQNNDDLSAGYYITPVEMAMVNSQK